MRIGGPYEATTFIRGKRPTDDQDARSSSVMGGSSESERAGDSAVGDKNGGAVVAKVVKSEDRVREMIHRFNDMGMRSLSRATARSVSTLRRSSTSSTPVSCGGAA